MARNTFEIKVTFNRFPEIAAKLPVETRRVVRKTAHDIEAHAKTVVPVDTGALKNSINTVTEPDGLTAIIAPHTEYAIYVEYGTRRMSAQPYMTPAAEANREPFKQAMRQLLERL